MTDSPDIPLELQRLRAPARGRSGNRRSELERLLDLTVLEPTHPELGSCWRFTGTTTPYGRIAKGRTATPTGWAGNCYAARSRTAWSYTTVAASTPAGIRTT